MLTTVLHNGLGAVLAQQKEFKRAAGQFQLAVRLNPDNVAIRDRWARALALAGELRAAAVQLRDRIAERMIPTRAYENGIFLAYANSAGVENGFSYLGKSVVATPDGVEAARAGAIAEIIFADLDPARVAVAQTRLPYLQDRSSIKLR